MKEFDIAFHFLVIRKLFVQCPQVLGAGSFEIWLSDDDVLALSWLPSARHLGTRYWEVAVEAGTQMVPPGRTRVAAPTPRKMRRFHCYYLLGQLHLTLNNCTGLRRSRGRETANTTPADTG